jgi:1-deoxy-D-xylulose-5-phosphate reductoisomerase
VKKKIIILGSTGSIGLSTVNIFKRDQKNFEVVLLSTNKNINKIIKQAIFFKTKYLIISDYNSYLFAKSKYKNLNLKIYNTFSIINKIFKKKNIYYSMSAIVGIEGLRPTLELIKCSKNIAIVNKEALVCGWNIIKKNLLKYKTNFIPIDSEHFSIKSLLDATNIKLIKKIFITASGGPFLNYKTKQFKNIKIVNALNHPNWKMGKKITIDSSTMMNKVFEIIEAKNIFNIPYKKISVLTHPNSYVHAIIQFENGLTKMLIHETDMTIPIFNSIYQNKKKIYTNKDLNIELLNSLDFKKINKKIFPLINILKILPNKNSLYETALITINDFFVNKFLEGKISYNFMVKSIYKNANSHEFKKLRNIKVKNLTQIEKTIDNVRFKL